MMEIYVLYHQNNPFPGYIFQAGEVDRSLPPDGSTMAEHVLYLKSKYGAKLKYFPLGPIPDKEAVKVVGNSLAPLAVNNITPKAQEALDEAQEAQDASIDYPNWGSIVSEVAQAFTDPKQKTLIMKLLRNQYWRTRGKPV